MDDLLLSRIFLGVDDVIDDKSVSLWSMTSDFRGTCPRVVVVCGVYSSVACMMRGSFLLAGDQKRRKGETFFTAKRKQNFIQEGPGLWLFFSEILLGLSFLRIP